MMIKMLILLAILLPMAAATTNINVARKETAPNNGTNANLRVSMTCDNYPRVCSVPGSPGPDCCRKKCVDVEKDALNCGRCGRRCRYGEVCCDGSCINIVFDPNNCGWCGNKCKNGGHCQHGMCNYA